MDFDVYALLNKKLQGIASGIKSISFENGILIFTTKDDVVINVTVPNMHSHSNKDLLDKLSVVDGKLYYDGKLIDGHSHDNKGELDKIVTGDKNKIDSAYTHSTSSHAPTTAQKNSDITKAEIEAKLTGDVSSHSHSAYAATGHRHDASEIDNLPSGGSGGSTTVVDNLTSTSTTSALSANQGRVIASQMDTITTQLPLTYEPKITTKGNAFNKNFGVDAGSVAEGNHSHSNFVNSNDVASDLSLSGTTLKLKKADGTTIGTGVTLPTSTGAEDTSETSYAERLASVELFIESDYYGGNQPVHPKVIALEKSIAGYKYWMAYTPYPYAEDNSENPHIACSNDLICWATPKGFSNPIDIPASGERYHSDTHILYNHDTKSIEVWYRTVKGLGVNIVRKTSLDGVNWSSRETLNSFPSEESFSAGNVSPVIIFKDGVYKIWIYDFNNMAGAGSSVVYYETPDATNWGTPIKCSGISNVWHFDIIEHNNEYIMYVDNRNNQQVLYRSSDGITWEDSYVIMNDQNGAYKNFYRGTLIFENNLWYFFYSFTNNDGSWGTSLSISKNDSYKTIKGIDDSYLKSMSAITQLARYSKYGDTCWDRNSNKLIRCIEDNGASGCKWVDVLGNVVTGYSGITPTSITLDKSSAVILVGTTEQLTATLLPSNTTNKSLNWVSSNENVAKVDSTGLVRGVNVGEVTVTAYAIGGNGKNVSCNITVTGESVEVTSVSLNKANSTLQVDKTEQLIATINPSNATDKTILWTSSNTNIITVSSNGLVTAKSVGEATVTATSRNGGKTDTCTYVITEGVSGNVPENILTGVPILTGSHISLEDGSLTPAAATYIDYIQLPNTSKLYFTALRNARVAYYDSSKVFIGYDMGLGLNVPANGSQSNKVLDIPQGAVYIRMSSEDGFTLNLKCEFRGNRFDKADILDNGYFSPEDGSWKNDGAYCSPNYALINGGTLLITTGESGVIYDENKAIIDSFAYNVGQHRFKNLKEGSYYVNTSINKNTIDSAYIYIFV